MEIYVVGNRSKRQKKITGPTQWMFQHKITAAILIISLLKGLIDLTLAVIPLFAK